MTRGPGRPDPDDTARPPARLSELGAAIRTGLEYLVDLSRLPAAVTDGRLEAMLRAALAGRDRAGPSAPAVIAACAHLGAGEYEDAYLALRDATDHLPRSA